MEALLCSMATMDTAEIEANLQAALEDRGNEAREAPPTLADAWEKYRRGEGLIPEQVGRNALHWGIPALDDELRSPSGSFGVIAAKTSAGKTSIAVQLAVHSASQGRRVHIVSLEQSREEVECAVIATAEGRTRREIERGGHDGAKYQAPWVDRITIDPYPSGTPWERIETRVRRLWRQGLDVLVVDYFTLLNPPETGLGKRRDLNTAQAFGEISKALRRISQELHIAVVVVAQFNRVNEDGTEPNLSNLRETGQLEQDATWALLMWTDLASIREAESNPGANRTIHARIAKNRGGRRWVKVSMVFDPARCQFRQLETQPVPECRRGRNAV
jgi:replicative DNA helicase